MKPDSIVICGLEGLLQLQDKHYLTPDIVVYGNRKLKVSQIFPAKKKKGFRCPQKFRCCTFSPEQKTCVLVRKWLKLEF